MSHTFRGEKVLIHHNPDLSGNVRIRVAADQIQEIVSGPGKGEFKLIAVPAQEILDFVGEIVRSQRISRLEDMTAKQVLGFLP